jgi:hypothetical protein
LTILSTSEASNLENTYRPSRTDAVTVQKDHDLAHGLWMQQRLGLWASLVTTHLYCRSVLRPEFAPSDFNRQWRDVVAEIGPNMKPIVGEGGVQALEFGCLVKC